MDKILNIIKKLIPRRIFKVAQPVYHFLLNWMAAVYYRHPSEEIIVIGVTGTGGKTSSVYMVARMLNAAGFKTGYTSTAMFSDGQREWLNDKKMTMPGRFFTQRILREMANNGCGFAVIETTSEGIVQYRHKFINYDILVFTGLYPEHIESHGGFEKYKSAKGKLFKHLKSGKVKYADEKHRIVRVASNIKKTELDCVKKTIIANGDDEHAGYFLNFWADKKVVYAKNNDSIDKLSGSLEVFSYGNIEIDRCGVNFELDGHKIKLNLLGEFNAANAMSALSIGLHLNIPFLQLKQALENIPGIPGRFEKIDSGQDFMVIVDYAYEPKALAGLYKTIKNIPHNKIIHVLGSAGGGRDKARRPKLGQLAGERSDIVIITNEDPYDEDPEIIIKEVVRGAVKAGKKESKDLFIISDRREAIKKAMALANKADIVLVTGKGSEQAICVKDGGKIKWDDREVVRELLKK